MVSLLLTATLGFLAATDGVGARFVYHDSATHDGHSVLHFRTLELMKRGIFTGPEEPRAVPFFPRKRYVLGR
jgi:hypothetical protein